MESTEHPRLSSMRKQEKLGENWRRRENTLCLNSLGFGHYVNLLPSIYHMVIPSTSTYDYLVTNTF